jgi:ABC-2 type transport system permease protein
LTAKKAARSGALWGYFFGVCVASSALTYLSSYKTEAAREKLAANFGANSALAALFGPAHELQTVAGFTAYKVLGFLSIVGAVWGLLAATRLLRGEEDSGRWEIVLSGQTTRKGAAVQALVGLGTGLVALYVVTGLVTVLTGRSSKVHFGIGESLFFALALVCSAAVFLAVGALTSHASRGRRIRRLRLGCLLRTANGG